MARLRWTPWALGAWVAGAFALAILGLPVSVAAGLAAAVVVQSLAGMVLWDAVLHPASEHPRDRLELWGMGAALGVGMGVVSGVVVDLVLPGWPGWLLPAVAAAIVWFRPGAGPRAAGSWTWRRNSLVAATVGIVAGLVGIRLNLAQYPLAWSGTWNGYHVDMVFFEGLSASIARFGPFDSIFMSGAQIRYHWLGYGWAGEMAESFGTVPFATLTRLLPVTALVALVSLIASWAGRRSSGWRVPLLAVLLVVTGGYLGASNGTILNFDSPSEAVSAMWLVALLIAFLEGLSRPARPLLVTTVAALGFLVVGGKISAATVGLAAMALVAVVLAVRRSSEARRAWVLVIAAGVGAVAAFVLLIAGTATDGTLRFLSLQERAAYVQGLVLDKTPIGIAAGTLVLLLAIGTRWTGLAWLVGSRASRWRAETVLGVGLVVASVIPALVLSEGVSETWFALAASAPLAVISAVGLGEAWARLQSPTALMMSMGSAVVVFAVVTFLWAQGAPTTGSARFWGPPVGYAAASVLALVISLVARGAAPRTLMWTGSFLTILALAAAGARAMPLVGEHMPRIPYLTGPLGNIGTDLVVVDGSTGSFVAPSILETAGLPPDRTAWSPTFADAASRLFALTTDADVIVTNDNTSFLVPALSRRQTYMSGATYQWMYGNASMVGGIPDRVRVSQAFVDDADPAAFDVLCRAGVTWLWASHDLTDRRDWEPYATVEFTNDEVSLARLDRSRCP